MSSLREKLQLLDTIKRLANSQMSVHLPLLDTVITTETGLPLKAYVHHHGLFSIQGDISVIQDPSASLISKTDATFKIRPR